MEFNRLSTILGMDQAEIAGAYADIASVRNANIQLIGTALSGASQAAGAYYGAKG